LRHFSEILHFIPDLYHLAGGPPQSVVAMADAMHGYRSSTIIHASRRNFLLHQVNIAHEKNLMGIRALYFLWPIKLIISVLKKRNKIIHVHSLFNLFTTVVLLTLHFSSNRIYIHPRGMLEPWGIKNSKTFIKNFWLKIVFTQNFTSKCFFIASTEKEKQSILSLFSNARVYMVPNGLSNLNKSTKNQIITKKGARKFLFLSRLHEKKGVEFLLEVWCQKKDSNGKLYIAGSGTDMYLKLLQQRVQDLGISDTVEFLGHVTGQNKINLFRVCDFFLFPSYSENFGNVVPEALSYGLPVITSSELPWDVLNEVECGVTLPHKIDSWVNVLNDLNQLQDADLYKISTKCKEFSTEFDIKRIIQKYEAVYND